MTDNADNELTDEERAAAKRAGMAEERFAALKGVRSLSDWEALQRDEREREQREAAGQ